MYMLASKHYREDTHAVRALRWPIKSSFFRKPVIHVNDLVTQLQQNWQVNGMRGPMAARPGQYS